MTAPIHRPLLPLARAGLFLGALSLGAAPALAGEVEVSYRFEPAGNADSFTFLDVEGGPLPMLSVTGPAGNAYKVALEVNDSVDDNVEVRGTLYTVKAKKKGERLTEVETVSLGTTDGQVASLRLPLGKIDGVIELDILPRLETVTLRRKAAEDLAQPTMGNLPEALAPEQPEGPEVLVPAIDDDPLDAPATPATLDTPDRPDDPEDPDD